MIVTSSVENIEACFSLLPSKRLHAEGLKNKKALKCSTRASKTYCKNY
jgi:hypothetical protein